MLGTSVFHSYAHQRGCQLQYNPRLNENWGNSDGEGLERIWSFLSPLISQLRYSTKNHRLIALDLRAQHRNEVLKTNGGMEISLKLMEHFMSLIFLDSSSEINIAKVYSS